jgi:hypothetical protein
VDILLPVESDAVSFCSELLLQDVKEKEATKAMLKNEEMIRFIMVGLRSENNNKDNKFGVRQGKIKSPLRIFPKPSLS